MKKILQTYLQYSKRIVIFGIIQWAIISGFIVLTTYILAFLSINISEIISDLLKNVISSSATLAVTIVGGYYAHSAYDNTLKNRIDTVVKTTSNNETINNG